jgi:Alanyl-tRNA synthetase
MTANEIRASFLKYFEQHGHRVVPSSPLVPRRRPDAAVHQRRDEPVQGPVSRPREARLHARDDVAEGDARQRQAQRSRQRRPSHRHHTFFEMLGNFSFGDYFKKERCPFAWTLLTDVWKMPADKLVVSIFKGENGIPRDDEAYDIWREPRRARRIASSSSAPTTTSGRWATPDRAAAAPRSISSAAAPARPEIEIWNNVFMEFERSAAAC